MKRLLLWALALSLSCGQTLAQSEHAKAKSKGKESAQSSDMAAVKDAIKKMEQEIRDGQMKGDSTPLEKYLADNSKTISGVSGQVYEKGQIVDRLKSGKTRYSQINISDDDVIMYGPTMAISHGTADVKLKVDGQDVSGKYHYSRIWMKRGGKWEAVWFQSTKMP